MNYKKGRDDRAQPDLIGHIWLNKSTHIQRRIAFDNVRGDTQCCWDRCDRARWLQIKFKFTFSFHPLLCRLFSPFHW